MNESPRATRPSVVLPVTLLCCAWLATTAGQARDGVQPASPGQDARSPHHPWLRTRVDLVSVPVTVTDPAGRLVKGLRQDDFRVFEDGVEQAISQFVGERVPVSLGILLDVSESMIGERMDDARFALRRFVDDLLAPEDEAFLMVFNHRPRLLVPWTLKPSQLGGQLDGVHPSGGTAVYDAIVEAIPLFGRRTHQRAAIVVISDGADTASDNDVKVVRTRLRREDAFVYAIAIDAPGKRPVSGHVNPYALRAFTDESGGYTEVVHDTGELVPATSRIAEELNNQYLLGYTSPEGADGEYHAIRVRVSDPSYRVRARRGYVAERRR